MDYTPGIYDIEGFHYIVVEQSGTEEAEKIALTVAQQEGYELVLQGATEVETETIVEKPVESYLDSQKKGKAKKLKPTLPAPMTGTSDAESFQGAGAVAGWFATKAKQVK